MKTYKNGLPFKSIETTEGQDAYKIFIDDLIERVDTGKASLLIIDGGLGEGKTTLAIETGDYINSKKDLPPINFGGFQYSMGGKEFLKKLTKCYENGLAVCIYDESGDYNRRGALSGFNKIMNRAFEVFRALRVLVILVLPSFHVLDGDLFTKGVVRGLAHCYGRTKDEGRFKVYELDRVNWIKEKMRGLPTKNLAYDKVYRNVGGFFLDLPKGRSIELDKVSTKGKIDILIKAELSHDGMFSYRDICARTGRSKRVIITLIRKLNLKAERKYKNELFFSKGVLDRISDHYKELDKV